MTEKPQGTEINVERRGPVAIVNVRGELDALAGPQLEEITQRSFQEGGRRCIVNLDETTFIDSIGVGALIRSHRAAAEHGGATLVAAPHGMIAQLLKVTQLNRILKVYDSLDEAVAATQADLAGPGPG